MSVELEQPVRGRPSVRQGARSVAGLRAWRAGLFALLMAAALAATAVLPLLAHAQGATDEADAEALDEPDAATGPLGSDDATRLLAEPVPADPEAAYALLQRQYRAALRLEDRPRQIALAQQLIAAGRGRPGGEAWVRLYLNAEFTWGSQGRALEASEAYVTDERLSLPTRAEAALRQTYFAAHGGDRNVVRRLWSRADRLAQQALAAGGPTSDTIAIARLQVRAEIERLGGDAAASLATLREAVGAAKRAEQAARARAGGSTEGAVADAAGWLDGSMGMLVYALVRQGRPQEAIDLARDQVALWRGGQLNDGLGARWHYRLATGLNATQQFEPALAAARQSDQMLQAAGAAATSHTRWLARSELVRALIGLKRWQDADNAYRELLAQMPSDALARNRASDARLLALLAAKNGRLDEAAETIERSYRYRQRLYGSGSPQLRETAGVRAVVRLMRGDVGGAMADYEDLFAATLDNPGGWLDLDLRGFRGFVLGVAFSEYLDHVAARLRKGETVPPALLDRAFQVADRSKLGTTQRALTDSTARVLAGSPALRTALEAEQAQRQALAAQTSQVATTLGEEDRLRRDMNTDTFKALPPDQRRQRQDELKALRDTLRTRQESLGTTRAALAARRDDIARQFPAYADLVTPAVPTTEQLRALLGPGEALLVAHTLEQATLVWLITADGPRQVGVSGLGAFALARRVAELRAQLDIGTLPADRRPALQPAAFHALYQELLGPLALRWDGVRTLIVATDGPLASLPFAALVTEPPAGAAPPAWLARRVAVAQIPSAAALQALRRVQPAPAARPLLGFGDPLFDRSQPVAKPAGPRLLGAVLPRTAGRYDAERGFRYTQVPPLPETRDELVALARALGADPQADLVLGGAATRRAVLAAPLQDRRVVAFATHGLMPGELPGISKPALAMAADTDPAESPLLELDDVLSLRLNAQWVVLSACNTAAGETGGAAMSGLVRGFFFAGGRSVLATHWAVDSQSAAALSAATFQAQAAAGATSRADSLRQAQLAMLNGTLGQGAWTHPFHWAPYALFGDPQR